MYGHDIHPFKIETFNFTNIIHLILRISEFRKIRSSPMSGVSSILIEIVCIPSSVINVQNVSCAIHYKDLKITFFPHPVFIPLLRL